MSKQPITDNLISDEELENLARYKKVGQYFIPTVSNVTNSSKEAHYKFKLYNNSLYLNMAGNNYRVIDLKLSEPKLLQTASGQMPGRDVVVKYLKTHSDEVASGACIACKSSAAERLVMDLAKKGVRTNISLENKGLIQKPLTSNVAQAKSAKLAHKPPQKRVFEEKKPDKETSLWHGLFKEIAPNILQTGCVITLILCVMGILVAPFMPFIVFGCIAGMLFPGKIIETAEKIVGFFPKTAKFLYSNIKFVKDCIVYNHQSKDFWGAKSADPRKKRQSQKADRKAFIQEVKERQAREKEADKKVRECTKLARKKAFKDVFLPNLTSTTSQNKSAYYNDYTNTFGM